MEDSGGFWKILEDSGGFWRILEDSGGFLEDFWRISGGFLEDSGGFWRIQGDSRGLKRMHVDLMLFRGIQKSLAFIRPDVSGHIMMHQNASGRI